MEVLGIVYRRKFLRALRKLYRKGKLCLTGPTAELKNRRRFAHLVDSLFQKEWIVYAKPAFGGPAQTLRYLGRYTHRVAISNHRLLAFDGEQVTFLWRDYAHGNRQRIMTLSACEFLRRFTQHILPRGFIRIRHFGFLTNTRRATMLTLARQLIGAESSCAEGGRNELCTRSTWRCPRCQGEMQIGPNLSARLLSAQCKYLDTS